MHCALSKRVGSLVTELGLGVWGAVLLRAVCSKGFYLFIYSYVCFLCVCCF